MRLAEASNSTPWYCWRCRSVFNWWIGCKWQCVTPNELASREPIIDNVKLILRDLATQLDHLTHQKMWEEIITETAVHMKISLYSFDHIIWSEVVWLTDRCWYAWHDAVSQSANLSLTVICYAATLLLVTFVALCMSVVWIISDDVDVRI
jgi:hypothetical protein